MKKYLAITLFFFGLFAAKGQNWNISLSPVDETCTGANDGKINLTITGSATGTFTWEIFESADDTNPFATGTYGTDPIDGLFPDVWTVEVTRNGTAETRTGTATVEGSDNSLTVTKSVLQQNLCNSDASGIIQATASDGAGSYLYGLGSGAGASSPNYTGGYADNNGLFEGLPANTYSVWAQDERGCVATTGDFILTAPKSITIEYDTLNANCNNIGGEITITAIAGGTPFAPGTAGAFNYEQTWYDEEGNHLSAFDNEGKLSGLDSGSYTVIITDKNGCTNDPGVTFQLSRGYKFISNGHQNVTCQDDNDGRISLSLGTDSQNDEEPFELRIYDGDMQEIVGKRKNAVPVGDTTFTDLGPDTYTIVATSADGCVKELEVEITQPDAPQLDSSQKVDLICRNVSTGEITWEVSGGSGNYEYSIDGGATYQNSKTFTELAAGTYTLTIRDNSTCVVTASGTGQPVTLIQPEKEWHLTTLANTNSLCDGANNGVYTFEFDPNFDTDPAVHPDDIVWTNRNSGEVIATGVYSKTDLDEGEYRITVTAESGCEKVLDFDISEPAPLEILATAPEIDCPLGQGSGNVSIDASNTAGGTTPYSFQWSKNGDIMPGETNNILSLANISEDAIYSLKVTDANDCEITKEFSITIPEEIVVSVESTTDVLCMGETTGSLEISVTGGSGSYGYTWTHDGNPVGISSPILTNLSGGTYEVEVRDNNNCGPVTKTIVIDEPTTTFTLSATKKDVVCAGDDNGEINLTIDNDNHTYSTASIVWTRDGEPFEEGQGKVKLDNLAPGAYQVTVTDANGCAKNLSSALTITNQNTLSINPIVTENLCNGDTNGQIVIDPEGGSGNNYTIEWKKGDQIISNNDTISNLSDGIYRVKVTDPIGCDTTQTFILDAPDDINAEAEVTNIACKGDATGAISLNITGGTEPYTISWEQGGDVLPSSSTSLTDLAPGTYDVTIEDANDCQPFTQSYTITEPSTEFTGVSLEPVEIQCSGESSGELSVVIDAEAGHTDDYDIKWYRNGTEVTTENATSAGSASPLTDLNAADYSVEVTDANGCVRTATYTLEDPAKITFNGEVTPVGCFGSEDGRISLNTAGGYGNFTYAWQYNGTALPNTNSFLNDLKSGLYEITITDAGGCEVDTTIRLSDPLPIEVTEAIAGPKCTDGSDGSITIDVTNGTPPYQFEWWHNDNRISLEQNISGLTEGTYMLIVSDQAQCQIDTLEYQVSDPPSDFTVEGTIEKITCTGETDATIDIDVVVSGEPDLEYEVYWEKNGTLYSQNTIDLINVGAGEYEVFVTDEYGCLKTRTFSLKDPDPVALSFNITDVSCYLDTDGSVAVQVTGGYGDYTYEWKKDGEPFDVVGSFANNLGAAFYELTVTDGGGCVTSQTVRVDQPTPFLIEASKKNNTCSTPFDSEISADITGGSQPYSLQWYRNGLPYSTEEDLSGIPSGTYQLIATDTNLCETTSAEMVIETPERLGIQIINLKENLCPTTRNGAISFQGTGGFFPYTYSFDTSAYETKNNYVNLPNKDYLISVQDNQGCTFDTLISLGNLHHLEPEFSMETDEFAIDFPISLADESLGDNIVEWFWDFGDTRASEEQNPTVTYTKEGTYVITLTVENEVGCRLSKSDTIEIVKGYNFTIPTAFTPNNDSHNDTFRPSFSNVESLHMKIQDRNGVLVFETTELSGSWNGEYDGIPAPQGAYYFEVTFTARSGKVRKEKGKVFLLR